MKEKPATIAADNFLSFHNKISATAKSDQSYIYHKQRATLERKVVSFLVFGIHAKMHLSYFWV